MENGEWKMESGKWRVENRGLFIKELLIKKWYYQDNYSNS